MRMNFFAGRRTVFATMLIAVALSYPQVGDADEWQTEHTLSAAGMKTLKEQDLGKLAWLEGSWKGEGFGGEIIETWGPPAGGVINGTFRLIEDDKLNFSEYFQIMRTEKGMVLRLKHFDSKMNGWEDKSDSVNFPLLKVTKNAAWFGGLTYERTGKTAMSVYLAMKQKDGNFKEVQMNFTRMKSKAASEE